MELKVNSRHLSLPWAVARPQERPQHCRPHPVCPLPHHHLPPGWSWPLPALVSRTCCQAHRQKHRSASTAACSGADEASPHCTRRKRGPNPLRDPAGAECGPGPPDVRVRVRGPLYPSSSCRSHSRPSAAPLHHLTSQPCRQSHPSTPVTAAQGCLSLDDRKWCGSERGRALAGPRAHPSGGAPPDHDQRGE